MRFALDRAILFALFLAATSGTPGAMFKFYEYPDRG